MSGNETVDTKAPEPDSKASKTHKRLQSIALGANPEGIPDYAVQHGSGGGSGGQYVALGNGWVVTAEDAADPPS